MATPDLTPYVDLTFFDKDPQDVFEAALIDLQSKLPDWTPREGNVEVLLMESLALQVAEAIFAANRLPGAVVQALLRLHGIEPDAGTPPTTTLTFEVSDALGHELPEGVGARLDLAGGLEPVVFTTDAPLSIQPGTTTGTVVATGDRHTEEANGTAAGLRLDLIDSIIFVERVTLGSTVVGGAEPETDEEWIERGVQRFARLSETLVLPKHFEAAALENAQVARVKALDNWNGSTGAPGDHAGHITVAVYGEGAPVPAETKEALDAAFEDASLATLAVHVVDPSVTAVPVAVSIATFPGYAPDAAIAGVEAALRSYLSTENWGWSSVVRRNELIAEISNVEGVDYVAALTEPAADVDLPGHAALATAGTITVTVV